MNQTRYFGPRAKNLNLKKKILNDILFFRSKIDKTIRLIKKQILENKWIFSRKEDEMLLNKNFKWLKAGAEAGEKKPETVRFWPAPQHC